MVDLECRWRWVWPRGVAPFGVILPPGRMRSWWIMLIRITIFSPSTVSLLGRTGDLVTWTFGNKPVIAVVSFSDLTEKIGIRVRVLGLFNVVTLWEKTEVDYSLRYVGRCKSIHPFHFWMQALLLLVLIVNSGEILCTWKLAFARNYRKSFLAALSVTVSLTNPSSHVNFCIGTIYSC